MYICNYTDNAMLQYMYMYMYTIIDYTTNSH